MKKYRFIPALLVIWTLSCGKDPGSGVAQQLPESRIVSAYADRLILYEEAKLARLDSAGTRLKLDSLYRSHSLTEDQLDAAVERYKKDLGEWKRFYDLVIRRLEQIQRGTGGRQPI